MTILRHLAPLWVAVALGLSPRAPAQAVEFHLGPYRDGMVLPIRAMSTTGPFFQCDVRATGKSRPGKVQIHLAGWEKPLSLREDSKTKLKDGWTRWSISWDKAQHSGLLVPSRVAEPLTISALKGRTVLGATTLSNVFLGEVWLIGDHPEPGEARRLLAAPETSHVLAGSLPPPELRRPVQILVSPTRDLTALPADSRWAPFEPARWIGGPGHSCLADYVPLLVQARGGAPVGLVFVDWNAGGDTSPRHDRNAAPLILEDLVKAERLAEADHARMTQARAVAQRLTQRHGSTLEIPPIPKPVFNGYAQTNGNQFWGLPASGILW
jgi:hypothetical protein